MEGGMKHAIMAGIGAALAAIGAAGDASAAVWRWGCMGPLGDQQILFTRYNLIVVPAKPLRGKLEDIIASDDLAQGASDIEQYIATDVNSGFTPTLQFTRGDDSKNKITLTEKSSKRLSRHTAIVACRDEERDVFRKAKSIAFGTTTKRHTTLPCNAWNIRSRPAADGPASISH
jgi:hypothetical protein